MLCFKNKRRLKWRNKIQIYQKCGKPVSKPAKTNSVSVGPCTHAPTHPWVKKTSRVNFKQKITTSTIRIALVQDIRLTTKKCVCIEKDLKTTSKSINQSRPVLML